MVSFHCFVALTFWAGFSSLVLPLWSPSPPYLQHRCPAMFNWPHLAKRHCHGASCRCQALDLLRGTCWRARQSSALTGLIFECRVPQACPIKDQIDFGARWLPSQLVDSMLTNGWGCGLIKLYLQKQTVGQIRSAGCALISVVVC